ncbi:hypothetical protein HFP89_09145 [Wenzhouxiangella sp. XN79A]|uniref:hypothetical protein n=1 Tax=Wenzhouxiangella sp. XN79A TaxID=2724193 RepID=UPI00144AF235|nr:hypothetical protein [Wenzhouxiangella sp. XN79A]NKI35332.1 hypothetical protein [Wenzhouxiangella sp. XN79A]
MIHNVVRWPHGPSEQARRLPGLLLAGLLACLLALAAPVGASESTDASDTSTVPAPAADPALDPVDEPALDPVAATAQWMLEQDDPRLRAAALVVRTGTGGDVRTATVIDAIRSTTDSAAMLWLAQACQSARIQRECIDAGLDDAIVRYDSANVFARATLYPEERIADLMLATRGESMHYFALIEAWYDALSRGPAAGPSESPSDRFAQAFAIGAAWATPALAPLAETCRSATPGAELDRACQQLAGRMVDGGESMLGFMIGRAIQRRGEPAGDDERATVTLASDRAACQMQALELELAAMDDAGIREFIRLLKRHGEFEAWDRLAETHEVDCSDPPSMLADHEAEEAAFNATVVSVAQDMVSSEDDRKRAAGLAWLLTSHSQPIEAPNELLDELDAQIRSITDPAALAWLAAACGNVNIEDFCLAAGLDAAIVRNDPGNLLSRLPLLDNTTIEPALLQSTRVRSYYDEAGATWYPELYPELDPLNEQEAEGLEMSHPMYVMSAAYMVPMLYSSPGFGPLTRFCGSREDADREAIAACTRIADALVETGRTFTERAIGIALHRQQAERIGNKERVAALTAASEHRTAVLGCQSMAMQATWKTMTRDDVEAWIAEQLEYGEVRAYARAAERAGVDCSDPPPWPPDFTGVD